MKHFKLITLTIPLILIIPSCIPKENENEILEKIGKKYIYETISAVNKNCFDSLIIDSVKLLKYKNVKGKYIDSCAYKYLYNQGKSYENLSLIMDRYILNISEINTSFSQSLTYTINKELQNSIQMSKNYMDSAKMFFDTANVFKNTYFKDGYECYYSFKRSEYYIDKTNLKAYDTGVIFITNDFKNATYRYRTVLK